jgi:lysophospholipase L1-like esterase
LSPYKDKQWAYEFWKEHTASSNADYEQFLGWDRREYHSKYTNVDSNGVRKTWNPEHFHDQPGTLYIFGGSTLWGAGARDDYTIPSYLSKRLNHKGYDFVVYNYGETGYTFTQEIIHLILLLREGHKPDYVIFYDGVNDVYGAYQSGKAGTIQNVSIMREKLKARNVQLILSGLTNTFIDHCMIYKAVTRIATLVSEQQKFQEVGAKYGKKELELLGDGISQYYIQSKELLDHLAQTYGFKYICFWQPVMFMEMKLTDEEAQIDPRLNDKALADLYRYSTNSLVAKRPAHFFDISHAISSTTRPLSCYIDFCHLSEEGNELVASTIFQIFEREFLLDE